MTDNFPYAIVFRYLPMDHNELRTVTYQTLLDLATDEGINASGKDEIYGCIFGRDSAITILKILKAVSHPSASSYVDTSRLLAICQRALLSLTGLQGKDINYESGEEPGKFVHEYRKDKFDHLLAQPKPWFVYPDGKLRNYDSLDSTPLALIALYRFWEKTGDDRFLLTVLPSVEKGLRWILVHADRDTDHLVEYELPKDRKHGGLPVQSWTDSHESILQPDGTMPEYPIAPVEVQGYTWLALRLWSDFYNKSLYKHRMRGFARTLHYKAQYMKQEFNKQFLYEEGTSFFPAQALDGKKKQIRTVTGNAALLLWATHKDESENECILDTIHIPYLVHRSFQNDLFDPEAGIRTMSMRSATYNANEDSYHNGSFWPKLNGMIHEGLSLWGYQKEADLLKNATLTPLTYFQSPIELYIKSNKGFLEYKNPTGQVGCRQQAWSAAAALDLLIQ